MSLWPIKTVTGIIEYELCTGIGIYNPVLCTPPRIYGERISGIRHFFYEPSNDRLVAYILMDQTAWPGWNALRFEWSAETGELINRTWCGIWAIAWVNHACLGSYSKIFATWTTGYKVTEVPWNLLEWTSPMWSIDPSTWNPSTIFNFAVVNLQDSLIAGVTSWDLQVWDISGTPTRRASMRLPNSLGYLAYESREICWIITRDGLILKANYKDNPPRWEMLSSVQDPSPDAINYFIAWDTKRSRVVVLRQRPDAVDGACQCQFEFYRPLVKSFNLTDPVPVNHHRAGDIVEFVAHLYGSAGEGVTPYRVVGSLQAPAIGTMLRSEGASAQNGGASFLYQAPAVTGTDTLVLEATITDGD